MQRISKMVFVWGLLFVVMLSSVEMYLINSLPIHSNRFTQTFTAPRQRFTRQPQYYSNQNLQVDPTMLLFQQSQENPRIYGGESWYNIQQQPIFQQSPPQASPKYTLAPKTQASGSNSASSLYKPVQVNLEEPTNRAHLAPNKDFLSTIEIIDNQGRPSNLKDLGIGNVEGQMYNPELAEQLISIFEKINQDLMNADFLPLDVEGANQQIGNMFQNQYSQQDISPQFQPNVEQFQQKPIEYRGISTHSPVANNTPVDQIDTKRYQYLKPVRSPKAVAQAPQQQFNNAPFPISNERPKPFQIQSPSPAQLLKQHEEKHQRQEYQSTTPPLVPIREPQANNLVPNMYQVPQIVPQPFRIAQKPQAFDNVPVMQKDVADDSTGFNDEPTPILPTRDSAISMEKPLVPQVVSFDSRIPSQQQQLLNVANEKPSIPLTQPGNFLGRPDIWIPMSMHPVQQQQQNFFKYETHVPQVQPIVQQREQYTRDERMKPSQIVTQEQESILSEDQNEQLRRKQEARLSQANIPNRPAVQSQKEFSQQKEQQQQQEIFDSQLDNQDEQQKLFDGSFGDSSTAKPVVSQVEDTRQSKSREQVGTSLINSFNSERSGLNQVDSQKSTANLNLQPFNQQKLEQFTTQQKESSVVDEQQQQEEVTSRKSKLDTSTGRTAEQQQQQSQQEELEQLVTTTVPSTTVTVGPTTSTSAPTTVRRTTAPRFELTKTRKIRIQSKNRSPVQIGQKNSSKQQVSPVEAKRSSSQQVTEQTTSAVTQSPEPTTRKFTQPTTADRKVPRLATRRFIVKSPRSKRPPPSVVKQQQEEANDNKSSLQEQQTFSAISKTIQDEQQRSEEDKDNSKQQLKEGRVFLKEESVPLFTEQTKMDVTGAQDDGFQSQEKSAEVVTTTQRDIVSEQKDDSSSSGLFNQKEEDFSQQKQDSAQQSEVLPEQRDEVSQERDTIAPSEEPVQAVTQQQQQQTQENVREQQKEITTTEVMQTQQQIVTSAQQDADRSQTEQKQDQVIDVATNKPQPESVQAQQAVAQEKQQQTSDASQTTEGFQADEEVGAPSTTRRPPTRFFSNAEQKELSQEKDTGASSEDKLDEEAEQKNSENLTAKLTGTRNAQQIAAAAAQSTNRKRSNSSKSIRHHNIHHELSSHQLLDTYNPLQFEPERIVSPKNADSSLKNTHVNLSDSY